MTTTNKTMAAAVKAHGEREGRADYIGRAQDVALGSEQPEWAWPFAGADEAYINAVGSSEICREIGVDSSAWDGISAGWLAAFEAGYRAVHAEANGAA